MYHLCGKGSRDHHELKALKPEWVPGYTQRTIANFLHDRIWAWFVPEVAGMKNVTVLDKEPFREIFVGSNYRIRLKRHRDGDKVSNVATATSLAFWAASDPTFEGMEEVRLALGYRWDKDVREIVEPVVSFRDGMEKPIWTIQLVSDDSIDTGFRWEPVDPDLPEMDLSAFLDDDEEGKGEA